MKNGELGAFPHERIGDKGKGLTKREHFAGLAMQAIISKHTSNSYGEFKTEPIIRETLNIADALLEALEAK